MAIYLKFGKVKGNVTHKGYEDWIELGSFQFGVGRGISTPVGAAKNREASAPSVSEVTVTKEMDKSSTDLFQASLSGAKGEACELAIVGTGDPATEICRWKFEQTLVSGYSKQSGGERPHEAVSLNFTKLEFENTELDTTNETGSPIRVTYDMATAVKG